MDLNFYVKDVGIAEDQNLQSYSQVWKKRDGNLKFFTATLFFLLKIRKTLKSISNNPFMIQSHAESIKKIVGAIWDLPSEKQSQSNPIGMKMGRNS